MTRVQGSLLRYERLAREIAETKRVLNAARQVGLGLRLRLAGALLWLAERLHRAVGWLL